jgi:hypothetical protein
MLQKEKNNWDDMIKFRGVNVEGAQLRSQERPISCKLTGKCYKLYFHTPKAPTREWRLFVQNRGTFI